MRAAIGGHWIEQVALLAMLGAVATGDVPVLLLHIQAHHAFRPLEQVGNDDGNSFAGARRGDHQDRLGASKEQVLPLEHAHNQPLGACQARFDHLRPFGKPGIAMQADRSLAQQQSKRHGQEEEGQRRRNPEPLLNLGAGAVVLPILERCEGCGLVVVRIESGQHDSARQHLPHGNECQQQPYYQGGLSPTVFAYFQVHSKSRAASTCRKKGLHQSL